MKEMSGSAVLSSREYENGDFEFKISPSTESGIITAIGLANDGPRHSDPFFQILFDTDKYGLQAFGVQLGGVANLFGSGVSNKTYTVNVSEILGSYKNISSALNYKIVKKVDYGDFEVHVATRYDTEGKVAEF